MPGYLVAACSLMLDVSKILAGWSAQAKETGLERLAIALRPLSERSDAHQTMRVANTLAFPFEVAP